MTMQSADYMKIDNRTYTLIDVEVGKQIVGCGHFTMPEGYSSEFANDTNCWRGYRARYFVEDNVLYGEKKNAIYYEESETLDEAETPRTMIPFTGSCIVAYAREDSWCNSDFIEAYVLYEEAYELYFEQGELIERLSLMSAIEKARAISETDAYKNDIEPYERGQLRKQIAREPLKYKYDERRTYKWRNDGDDDW